MGTRLQLHEVLTGILGSPQAYFQPPENVKMVYPAIVYALSDLDNRHADNLPYVKNKSYQVTVIDRNPDTLLRGKVADLPMASFDRFYVADNLNHYVFTIYF